MTFVRLLLAGAAAATIGMLSTGAQASNLVTNGSFEDATNFVDNGQDTMQVALASTLMTGWTVIGGHDTAWIGPTNPFSLSASDGRYFQDLTSYYTGGPFSGVSQSIATQAGHHYLLTFDLGSSTIWGLPSAIQASAGASSQTFTSTLSTTNGWEGESLAFTASGASTNLSLLGTSGFNYIGLDNVSVVDVGGVPEPATWTMMLIGFGGLGAALRSRRKSAALAA